MKSCLLSQSLLLLKHVYCSFFSLSMQNGNTDHSFPFRQNRMKLIKIHSPKVRINKTCQNIACSLKTFISQHVYMQNIRS